MAYTQPGNTLGSSPKASSPTHRQQSSSRPSVNVDYDPMEAADAILYDDDDDQPAFTPRQSTSPSSSIRKSGPKSPLSSIEAVPGFSRFVEETQGGGNMDSFEIYRLMAKLDEAEKARDQLSGEIRKLNPSLLQGNTMDYQGDQRGELHDELTIAVTKLEEHKRTLTTVIEVSAKAQTLLRNYIQKRRDSKDTVSKKLREADGILNVALPHMELWRTTHADAWEQEKETRKSLKRDREKETGVPSALAVASKLIKRSSQSSGLEALLEREDPIEEKQAKEEGQGEEDRPSQGLSSKILGMDEREGQTAEVKKMWNPVTKKYVVTADESQDVWR